MTVVAGSLLYLSACTQPEPVTPPSGGSQAASIPGQFPSGRLRKNEQYTADAWASYNSGRYEDAIRGAEACVDEFQGAANIRERELESAHTSIPVGTVSDEEKTAIFQNGLLNDVATCLFIEGKSAMALGQKDEARQAFSATENYRGARTWDPDNNGFWSPAEGAAEQLELLK